MLPSIFCIQLAHPSLPCPNNPNNAADWHSRCEMFWLWCAVTRRLVAWLAWCKVIVRLSSSSSTHLCNIHLPTYPVCFMIYVKDGKIGGFQFHCPLLLPVAKLLIQFNKNLALKIPINNNCLSISSLFLISWEFTQKIFDCYEAPKKCPL